MKPITLERVCKLDRGRPVVLEYMNRRGITLRDAIVLDANERDTYMRLQVKNTFANTWDATSFAKPLYGSSWRLWSMDPTPKERKNAPWT